MSLANVLESDVLEIVRLTDVGLLREHNEDTIASDSTIGYVVLADGMGGYKAGEVASEIAVLSIAAELTEVMLNQPPLESDQYLQYQDQALNAMQPEAQLLVDAVKNANDAIYYVSQTQSQCAGMGTTLVLGLFINNRLLVGHIGDSRMYRLRGLEFIQLTEDHSILQEQLNAGLITAEQAKYSVNRNLVTRALGVEPEVPLELNEFDVEVGDVYLLCSDGLTDMVDDSQIQLILSMPDISLDSRAQSLIQLANEHGGKDNISVILVQVNKTFEKKRPKRKNLGLNHHMDNFFGWLK